MIGCVGCLPLKIMPCSSSVGMYLRIDLVAVAEAQADARGVVEQLARRACRA